ncbi:MAG: ABC-F family ATP-binding cassette domain-containing protein [Chloroflexi bacterium]|nr:ABC-F family ATP-binding cassette domain-containing protein [Chloroflexota bacterium]
MSLIVAQDIGKYYGGHDVFSHINVRVEAGDRIGLVGPNGEGKSTLLRILAGVEEPTAGHVKRSHQVRVGYLPQDPPLLSDRTLWEVALEGVAHLRQMEEELEQLASQLADGSPQLLERYGRLEEEFKRSGGYDYPARVRAVLLGLGFQPHQFDQPVTQLSGGQRTRALLAQLLLQSPDLLLLDEPTNHLDVEALEWLETWLRSYPGSFVVIAHDRYFLDAVTNRIWELGFGRLEVYRGNYSAYLRQREERFRARLREWEKQQTYIRQTEEFIRRNIAGQRSREARGRRTRLQRFLEEEAIERPREHRQIRVRLRPRYPSGELVFQTRHLVVGYDRPLLRVPDLTVRRGERIAIVGPNGAGKTTLLRTLLGELPPLEGTVRRGAGVRIGYVPQHHTGLDPQATVLETLRQAAPQMEEEELRSLLGQLLFHGDDVFKRVEELSGGQRTRVVLALLSLRRPNTLLLDEPTNHLDLPSQEILQEVLQAFEGTLLFVSHDRYLIQGLATHVWVVEGDTVHTLLGNWDAYRAWREKAKDTSTPARPKKTSTREQWEDLRAQRRARQEREKRQQQLRQLEETIERMENRLQALGEAIDRAGQQQDVEKIHRLGEEYRRVEQRLAALWQDWEERVAMDD